MDPATSISEIISTLQSLVGSSTSLNDPSVHPVLPISIPERIESRIPLPETASQHALETVQSHLSKNILPYLNHSSLSPNYYGFVTGGVTPAALLADFAASIYDQNVCVHLPRETIATNIEVTALNLLVQLLDLPTSEWSIGTNANGGGTFTTGATASNFLGLALGREFVLSKAAEKKTGKSGLSCGDIGLLQMMKLADIDRIQILSSLPHSSIGKVASMVGIGRANIISIAHKSRPWELDLDILKREITKSDAKLLNILVISAGEVNTGRFATSSLETMHQLRQLCDANGIWIHVDGAFGLFGRLLLHQTDSSSGKDYKEITDGVQGLELADSITGDAHKLLNVPYDCGFFFTRHKNLSEAVFRNGNAAYLATPADQDNHIQTPLNIGIENSRRFRALPVYATLLAYGRGGYTEMLERQITLARRVVEWLVQDRRFEVLPSEKDTVQKTFMIVLFRARDPGLNEELVKRINETRRIYVSGTVWDGQKAARIAISNWRVNVERDFKVVVEVLGGVA